MIRRWALYALSAVMVVPILSPMTDRRRTSRPAVITPRWRGEVLEYLRAEEYRPRDFAGEHRAQFVNRAQGLRAWFRADGVEFRPREGDDWHWGVRVAEIARGEARVPVPPSEPRLEESRVSYERAWGREWYENRPEGIEQLFEIWERPPGDGPLEIRMHVEGLRPSSVSAQRVTFAAGAADVLTIAKLSVSDAAGQAVPAEMAWADGSLNLRIRDETATYPIMVDPLASSPAWTAESDQAWAYLGNSVATAGDVNGDGYDDVIVGAYMYNNPLADEGRALVFHGSPTGLSGTPNWIAEGEQDSAFFGISVAAAGDVDADGYADVIVGAYLYNNPELDEGRVFVYHGSAAGLSSSANWTAEINQATADFGACVSTAGDVNGDGYSDVVIGADFYQNDQTDEGAAFVYHGSATGLSSAWDWMVEGNQANCGFGASVSTAGDVDGDGYDDVIVGAYLFNNGQSGEGRLFVYHGSAGGLSSSANWTAESNMVDARLGNSVSTAGDVDGDGFADIIAGAFWYTNPELREGAAFVYHGSAGGLPVAPSWSVEGNQASAYLGISVAAAGDVNGDLYGDVIVGAYWYDNPESNEGIVRVYEGSAAGLPGAPSWTADSNQASAYFGRSVSGAGDVNGDGFGDVIVGAYGYDNPDSSEGRAFVYHGAGGPGPVVTNVTSSTADGSYGVGAAIAVTVTFSAAVYVTGTPQLTLATGGPGTVVNYAGGSGTDTLTFTYTVGAGQNSLDLDYTASTALALNGGTIQDGASNNAVLTLPSPGAAGSLGANKAIVIDTTAPTVTNVTSTTADGTYGVGATIAVTVTFSEAVTVTGTPQLTLATGGPGTAVNYSSGSGSNTLTFTYAVAAGHASSDLDYTATTSLSGTIQDAALNNATLTLASPGTAGSLGANKAIVIDTTAPTVTNVTSTTADGTYGVGATIAVTVTFSEAVTVTGTPQLTLATGGPGTAVNYSSGSGSNTLTFTYAVAAGHASSDLDY
ncbi:MAG: FG-GAP repeat protein, partial [Planctomycetes bacterium]|nr:FG-GAP repeat protein [Planctomycetota bacterium]